MHGTGLNVFSTHRRNSERRIEQRQTGFRNIYLHGDSCILTVIESGRSDHRRCEHELLAVARDGVTVRASGRGAGRSERAGAGVASPCRPDGRRRAACRRGRGRTARRPRVPARLHAAVERHLPLLRGGIRAPADHVDLRPSRTSRVIGHESSVRRLVRLVLQERILDQRRVAVAFGATGPPAASSRRNCRSPSRPWTTMTSSRDATSPRRTSASVGVGAADAGGPPRSSRWRKS